ncbi:GNAT family N-acetyltransferase [Sinosporangium siamense]|uniref:Acetyltransferase n=1 Tax=Sinosporangium siamense TaxID=1367973 RepID=A0A919RPN4_9ACTN|nr:GNAT family N-acetyltransferase [Sinosporangium siamense]GII95889.1 acetyltransferase [Sinosporangium siamense]
MTLVTDRLILRRWTDADREPFAALCADPEVMEFFPSLMDRTQCDTMVDRIMLRTEELGYGLWAMELRATGEFVGFTGLAVPSFEAHFTPAVEVGWRLARSAWGYGYATEAAIASLDDGFTRLGLESVVSMTYVHNGRSRAVMERLGMRRDEAGDFDHPLVPEGNPVRPHVLYRLTAAEWAARGTSP